MMMMMKGYRLYIMSVVLFYDKYIFFFISCSTAVRSIYIHCNTNIVNVLCVTACLLHIICPRNENSSMWEEGGVNVTHHVMSIAVSFAITP